MITHISDVLQYGKLSEVTEVFLTYLEEEKDIGVAAKTLSSLAGELLNIGPKALFDLINGVTTTKTELKGTHRFDHTKRDPYEALNLDTQKMGKTGQRLLHAMPGGMELTNPEGFKLVLDDKKSTLLEKAFLFQFIFIKLLEDKMNLIDRMMGMAHESEGNTKKGGVN